jgi:hypothetical protein
VLLPSEELTTFLADSELRRPPVADIQAFLARGVSEETLLSVGLETEIATTEDVVAIRGIMAEVDNLLPYMKVINVAEAEKFGDRRLFFAGRDGGILYDGYVAANPENEAAYLPASRQLWSFLDKRSPAFVNRFFEGVGLEKERVMDGGAALIDTGFNGTIGDLAWKRLSRLYDVSYDDVRQKLPIGLVSAVTNGFGEQLVAFPFPPNPGEYPDLSISGRIGWAMYDLPLPAAMACIALQLLPHHHGSYASIKKQGERVVAVPKPKTGHDFDVHSTIMRAGSSVIDPLVATVVQLRVVGHMQDAERGEAT